MENTRQKGTENEVRLEVVIGKDILELLSSSMYIDPLTIYREYVQNAADAIDVAVDQGLLADRSEGRIEISLDHIGRRALIRDNGVGVNNQDFWVLLTSFGASRKRGSAARGFRGVGRLAGLGYCQELVFRSRASIDQDVQELRWDCRLLKQHLQNTSHDMDLGTIVSKIVEVNTIEDGEYPDRFFEVEIVKPRRIGSDILLNEAVIENYLGQVGPVPFNPSFNHTNSIQREFEAHEIEVAEFDIRINGADVPVYRPYLGSIPYSETKVGYCQSVEAFCISSSDGEPAAVGWLMHHDYQGAIPESLGVRGLRARVGNIQIGDERIFSEVFPEERFNSWTLGEVHVLDRRIVPNGRRDAFEQNSHYSNLVNHLATQTGKIARQCRSSSQIRNRIKAFEIGVKKIEEDLDVLEQGAISKTNAKTLRKAVGSKLLEVQNAAGFDLLYDGLKSDFRHKIDELEARVEALSNVGGENNPLAGIPKHKRSTYKEVIGLIYECSVNRVAAKSLVDKILARTKHT